MEECRGVEGKGNRETGSGERGSGAGRRDRRRREGTRLRAQEQGAVFAHHRNRGRTVI